MKYLYMLAVLSILTFVGFAEARLGQHRLLHHQTKAGNIMSRMGNRDGRQAARYPAPAAKMPTVKTSSTKTPAK